MPIDPYRMTKERQRIPSEFFNSEYLYHIAKLKKLMFARLSARRTCTLTAIIFLVVTWTSTAAALQNDPVCPMRSNWKENPEDCPCISDWIPTIHQLELIITHHQRWLQRPPSTRNISGRATLCNADLSRRDLSYSNLRSADLRDTTMFETRFVNADLSFSDLRNANLQDAALVQANLSHANLENAYLSDSNLQYADLTHANLTNVYMQRANMDNSTLRSAYLRNARLQSASLRDVDFRNANMQNVNLRNVVSTNAKFVLADLTQAILVDADLRGAKLTRTILANADLRGTQLPSADLREADLNSAQLQGSNLKSSSLQRSKLSYADFRNADLRGAKLNSAEICNNNYLPGNTENQYGRKSETQIGVLYNTITDPVDSCSADFSNANLEGADLTGASFKYVNFSNAVLSKVKFIDTDLQDSSFAGATVTQAEFAPVSLPNVEDIGDIEGLETIVVPDRRQSGITRLRDQLREHGFRYLERQVTFAINSNQVRESLDSGSFGRKIDAGVQQIFFGSTVGWGLHPWNAVWIMLIMLILSAVPYSVVIAREWRDQFGRHGIYKIDRREGLDFNNGDAIVPDANVATKLLVPWHRAWLWGIYFSLQSAFFIGWRDINLGTWLSRMQWSEYNLRAFGWVRTWAGIQSIISIFLVSIWALSYFGRPF